MTCPRLHSKGGRQSCQVPADLSDFQGPTFSTTPQRGCLSPHVRPSSVSPESERTPLLPPRSPSLALAAGPAVLWTQEHCQGLRLTSDQGWPLARC